MSLFTLSSKSGLNSRIFNPDCTFASTTNHLGQISRLNFERQIVCTTPGLTKFVSQKVKLQKNLSLTPMLREFAVDLSRRFSLDPLNHVTRPEAYATLPNLNFSGRFLPYFVHLTTLPKIIERFSVSCAELNSAIMYKLIEEMVPDEASTQALIC